AVLAVLREVEVHAVAHITGGGLAGNIVRVLPEDAAAVVDTTTWEQPRIFSEIQRLGSVELDEMRRVFNCGIGMVLALPADRASTACAVLASHGHRAVVIGEVVAGPRGVTLR